MAPAAVPPRPRWPGHGGAAQQPAAAVSRQPQLGAFFPAAPAPAQAPDPPIIAAFSRLHTNVACRGIYDHGGKMHVSQLTMQLVRMYPGLTSHSLALAQSLQLLCVLLHAAETAARAVS